MTVNSVLSNPGFHCSGRVLDCWKVKVGDNKFKLYGFFRTMAGRREKKKIRFLDGQIGY